MPPLPISVKVKSSPMPSISKIYNLEKLEKLETSMSKFVLKKYFNQWKSIPQSIKRVTPIEAEKKPIERSSRILPRHQKKVSEFVQKPFALLLLNSTSKKTHKQKASNINVPIIHDELNMIKEESENVNDKELIKKALEEYEHLTKPKKGFKVFRIAHDFHQETAKSLIIPEDFEGRSAKRRFDKSHSGSKTKTANVSILKPQNKDAKKLKKHKTKEALKRYRQINQMLEKIQKEATKLGSEYEQKKATDS